MRDTIIKLIDDWSGVFLIVGLVLTMTVITVTWLITEIKKLFPSKPKPTITKEQELANELALVRREKEQRELALQREIEEIKKKNQTKQSHLEDDTSTPIF